MSFRQRLTSLPHPGRLLTVVSATLIGALTCVLSVLLPLAPVVVSTPTIAWPQAGQPATSTIALFMPYRPLDLTANVPCPTVTALVGRAAPGQTLLAVGTAPATSQRGAERSLAITVTDGSLRVRSSGVDLFTTPVTDPRFTPGCSLRVLADQLGTTVSVLPAAETPARVVLASNPGLPVPEVDALITDATAADLAPEAGTGPTVTAHPDARFESRPSTLKIVLLTAYCLLAVLSFLVLVLFASTSGTDTARCTRPERLARTGRRRWRRLLVALSDTAVVVGLVVWAGAGPLQTDDFYYVLEARSIAATGYVGNVVRYFNVPEIPFTLQQYLLGAVSHLSVQPMAMRLPAALAGIGTWWLLSRVIVPRLIERPPVWTRPLAALALLAWWLPFNISARPESLVVLLSTLTLAAILEAIGRRRVWLLGVAALAAGTAVAVTASGFLAAAMLVVLTPRWWPVVTGSRLGPVATGAALLACLSVCSPLIFADATLATAMTSLRVHDEVGPNLSWWQEPQRYAYLTAGPDPNQRLYSRQVVVALTLVLLIGVSMTLLRARRRAEPRTAWVVPAVMALTGFAALLITPTKWTHHFGALAGVATLLVVAACVVLIRRRPSRWAMVGLCAALAGSAGLAMHGPNAQVEYSGYAVTESLPPVLGQPLLWAGLAALLAVPLMFRRGKKAPRDRWPEIAALTVAVVLVASVGVQVGSVAQSSWRLRGSWSVASDAVAALSGESCGFADAAVALTGEGALASSPRAPQGPGAPALRFGAAAPALLGTVPAGVLAWSPTQTGSVTPWLALGERSPSQTLAFDVLGEPADVEVTAEFVDAAGSVAAIPAVLPAGEGWRRVGFGPLTDAPAGAVDVRLRIRQLSTDAAVVAVTDMYRRTSEPLSQVLPRDRAVLLDWPIGLHLPCAAPPRVAGGMSEPVDWFVQSATFEVTPPLTIIDGGGAYATLPEVATLTPYRGFLPGAPYREWGNLVRIEYPLPTGRYDTRPGTRTVPGWRWWNGAGPGPSPEVKNNE